MFTIYIYYITVFFSLCNKQSGGICFYCNTSTSSSVYSPFFDRVGLTPHNTPFPGVLMKSIGAAFFLRPDANHDINHMRGMQYQIVLNIAFYPKIQLIQVYKFVCTIPTQNSNINLGSKPPFSRLLRHTWVKAVFGCFE